MAMTLIWNKCQGDIWCPLNTVNLPHPHFDNMEGVYVIWHGGPNATTVRVGKGNIRDRLTAHRSDASIQTYASLGLYVTWAKVMKQYQDGIEHFLAQKLQPLIGDRFPDAVPIEVNLPW